MKIFKTTKSRYILNTIAVCAVYGIIMLLINGGVLNRYQANMFIPICYNIIIAVSLNFATGFLGQLPLGHAGFMAVGAYSSALFTLAVDLPSGIEMILALLIAGIVSGIFGILIGLPALRLRGDYLAIITLGFGEIIRVILLNLDFTGGAFGLSGIQRLTSVTWAFFVMVVSIFVISVIIKSRHGRAILSIRENEIAAESCGINTTYYKTMVFALSAFFAGIGGALYAHYLKILDPSNFGFMKSVEYLVMVVLGGMGSIIGSVISATVLTLLPELLRGFANYRMVIYALLLVIVMIFKPSGLMGTYDFSLGHSLNSVFTRIKDNKSKKGKGEENNE
ncbi:MAG: branched-chain amino acid ABC transporter permease [Oscillospiraceae bacterium]|jgi:branched-chain amino acid transport system permease protein